MHAVLGLAASHLQLSTGQDLHAIAIHHRLLAIRGFNAAISQDRRSGADGDAVLASCYALTFQSCYMDDGIAEFFKMVRGCSILSHQLKDENIPMAFFLDERSHFEFMAERLTNLPTIHPELIDGCERSLAALPVLFDRPSHVNFYKIIFSVNDALKVSSMQGSIPPCVQLLKSPLTLQRISILFWSTIVS